MEAGDDEELSKDEAKEYRAMVATINYLSADCPDLQFPNNQCSRDMAKPVRGSWKVLKKVVGYLVGRKSVVWNFGRQEEVEKGYVVADSNWGGIARTESRLPEECGCWESLHQNVDRAATGLCFKQRGGGVVWDGGRGYPGKRPKLLCSGVGILADFVCCTGRHG